MKGHFNASPSLKGIDLSLLQRAVEASRSPLIVTDNGQPDNPIIYANEAFRELTGYEVSEIIGKNCRFLQGPDSEKASVKKLRASVKDGTSTRVTLKNYRKDGTPFWNDLLVSPVVDADGTTTHFIGMQLDITERVEVTRRLEAKTRELEAANKELEQFTYATSHDLQEPLRMITSYLQLIERRHGDQLSADARTFFDFAMEGAERMQELIYDLLSLSRVTTTSETFKTVQFNKILERATFNLKLSLEESKAILEVGELPELRVDAVQMTQLFQNLISNALKYRRSNANPVIKVTAERDGSLYIFGVSDNGIGIGAQYHERIFQVFQRLHTRGEYPGTGVGLSICKKIVERHGGKIWVESEPGHGSTFKFSLPVGQKGSNK